MEYKYLHAYLRRTGKGQEGNDIGYMQALKNYPSVETLQALLYRAGAVGQGRRVVVTFDPLAAWVEACGALEVSCISLVTPEPAAYVKQEVDKMWSNSHKGVVGRNPAQGIRKRSKT